MNQNGVSMFFTFWVIFMGFYQQYEARIAGSAGTYQTTVSTPAGTTTPQPSFNKFQWLHKFNKNDTHTEPFHLNEKETTQVPMMKQTNRFNYVDKLGYQLVQLFFKDTDYSLVVIAYKKQYDLLNSPLPFHLILGLFHSAQYETVDLKVPSFKHSPLKDMNTMFGMPFQNKDVKLTSDSIRNDNDAYVKVDEDGVSALLPSSSNKDYPRNLTTADPEKIVRFHVDHPFLFCLLNKDQMMAFGYVTKPEAP